MGVTKGNTASTQRKHRTFHDAIIMADLKEVKAWLDFEDGASRQDLLHSFDSQNYSPLDRAVQMGDLRLVKLLIDQGVNVNHADENEMTSVHFAAKLGSLEILKLMLEHGGDIHVRTTDYYEPLHYALNGSHLDCAAFLLSEKSNVNHRNRMGRGYLYLVLASDRELQEEKVQLLLDHDIESDQIKNGRQTALQMGLPHLEQLLRGHLLAKEEKEILQAATEKSMGTLGDFKSDSNLSEGGEKVGERDDAQSSDPPKTVSRSAKRI